MNREVNRDIRRVSYLPFKGFTRTLGTSEVGAGFVIAFDGAGDPIRLVATNQLTVGFLDSKQICRNDLHAALQRCPCRGLNVVKERLPHRSPAMTLEQRAREPSLPRRIERPRGQKRILLESWWEIVEAAAVPGLRPLWLEIRGRFVDGRDDVVEVIEDGLPLLIDIAALPEKERRGRQLNEPERDVDLNMTR